MVTLCDVVMKLIGPVEAIGDHGIDQFRLANLERLTELVDTLVGEVRRVERDSADVPAASVRAIHRHANGFLNELMDALEENL